MHPELLWRVSRDLHRRGHRRAAHIVKTLNYVLFRCVLPPEVQVDGEVTLLHRGLGVVIDPEVRIVGSVQISHGVTIGTGGGDMAAPGPRVTLLDECFIGAHATVLAPRSRAITIGRGAAVGANSHVFRDVPDHHRVGAPEAQLVRVVEAPADPES